MKTAFATLIAATFSLAIPTLAYDVQGLDKLNTGDMITLQFTEALAMRMIKE